jgi:hypothetical protein
LVGSTPTTMSRTGKTPKTSRGPVNQKPDQPVASTEPQAMKGARGMIRPSSQA